MDMREQLETQSAEKEYTPHQAYPGVSLKHLVKGEETGGKTSLHLVRVAPGCRLEEHTHPEQAETHTVVSGSGECRITGRQIPYRPGVIQAIPQNVRHMVIAGEDDLYILASFTPALV